MISRAAMRIQEETRKQCIKIFESRPNISKNQLEKEIRVKMGSASSGIVSRTYNKHRRNLKTMQVQQRL